MIGTVLSNRYKLVAELGSGGMAWVYLAEDLLENETVAVKVLYPQHSQDLGFLQRFIREAKLSMTLSQSSPQRNIVRVLDYGADRDTHYLVMEYVQGHDLGQVLEQDGPLPWQKALDFAHQVALALEHANQLDIVHRDIKPSNIMVGPNGTVRVLDFGIARARTSPHLTLSGFVGSPHYAAPEQATGQEVDIRADIYSLGVVLYTMLSGDPPFQGDTPWAVVNQHIVSDPPPLEETHPDLPQPILHLVQKAMAKHPEDRFQTPSDLLEAIEAILEGSDLPFEPLPSAASTAAPALAVLYQRAQQAVQGERWQEAVELFSQILKVDPDYRDVTEQLEQVGQQIRLANLYRSAHRSLQSGQWDRALAQLDRIAQVAPDYKDIQDLRVQAEEKLQAGEAAPASEFATQIPTDAADEAESRAAGPARPGERPALVHPPAEGAPSRRRGWRLVGIALLILILATATYFLFAGGQEPSSPPIADAQPSPTSTARPTLTPVPTTLTPRSTSTIQSADPTDTPVAAGVTASPTSTPTPPSPSPSATPTHTPTPTPTPTTTPTPTSTTVTRTRRPPTGQIAFPRFDRARGTFDVYACQVDGSNCRLVVSEASQPDFLPDGTQLVVHSWKAGEKGLILLSLSGERIWHITDTIEAARPSVDFLGEAYVYHSRQDADRRPRLYRTYGTETRTVVREASPVLGHSPSWLPDRRILYSGCWTDNCGIILMRADGTFPQQVAAGNTETNPEASPDGRRVAFMSLRDGNWEVYLVNVDGSNLRRLTRNPANDGLPTWSPDGRYIAFVTDRDGPWAVWVMRPDGSGQRRLFDIGGPMDGRVRTAPAYEAHGWVEERISWAPLP